MGFSRFKTEEIVSSNLLDGIIEPDELKGILNGKNKQYSVCDDCSFDSESKTFFASITGNSRPECTRFLFVLILDSHFYGVETTPPFMGDINVSVFLPEKINEELVNIIISKVSEAYSALDINYVHYSQTRL